MITKNLIELKRGTYLLYIQRDAAKQATQAQAAIASAEAAAPKVKKEYTDSRLQV
jgi:hypothetical protein